MKWYEEKRVRLKEGEEGVRQLVDLNYDVVRVVQPGPGEGGTESSDVATVEVHASPMSPAGALLTRPATCGAHGLFHILPQPSALIPLKALRSHFEIPLWWSYLSNLLQCLTASTETVELHSK